MKSEPDAVVTKLRDLIRIERETISRVPLWIGRLVAAGIVSTDHKVARRQKIVNVASFAGALNSISRVIASSFYEFDGAYLVQLISAAFAVSALIIQRLHRFGDNMAAMALLIWFLLSVSFASVISGLSSQIQVYFVLAGVTWFLFGLERWKLALAATAVNCAVMLVILRHAPYYGIAVERSPGAADYFALQSMLNAIAINSVVIVYALILLRRAESELERQTERAESLLKIVLPEAIARRLRAAPERRIADRIDGATILFADLEGFTNAAHAEPPEVVVDYLDRLVRDFDEICEREGVDKIKSIGDAYMAAGGLQGSPREGAIAIGRVALAMLKHQASLPSLAEHRLRLRIGIHTGTAIAGVIGDTRISYDLWGDAVNQSSRMESNGVPGRIHVSDAYRRIVGETFEFEDRGETELKGIGAARTYFLVAQR